ncbi:MAG: ThuA domain-containing protein [Verrucomicrobiales bacterium]|nr:ThuA domain-containing protein [Verrucomicrobiales bacterium]
MKKQIVTLTAALSVAIAALSSLLPSQAEEKKNAPKPLRALLILGGCCHDYKHQKDVLKAGLEQRANLAVDVCYSPDTSTKAKFPCYDKENWAAEYDVIIHDECSADVTDPAYVKKILDAHRGGIPAVNLHCAMHSYRWGNFRQAVKAGDNNAGWYEMLGLQSTGHGPQQPIAVTYTAKDSPVTKGLADWTTINEELYNNVQILPTAKPLARGKQGKEDTVVVWTNEFGGKKTRIFSTTLGHNTETVADDRYLDLVCRGLLWVCGKLDADGKPAAGYGAAAK